MTEVRRMLRVIGWREDAIAHWVDDVFGRIGMRRYTLLIDGEFGFANTFVQTEVNNESISGYSLKRRKLLTFETESSKPLDYVKAYSSAMESWEFSLSRLMEQENQEKFEVRRVIGLNPGWLRLTIVERWAEEVD